jgi:GT2 family glycosyltransferase
MKRYLYLELGKFDPLFFMYCEDTDLSLRALRKGIPIYTTNITYLIHQKEDWYMSDFQYYLLERNRILTFLKNINGIKKLFPIFLITELGLLFHSIILKKFKIRIAIYKNLFKNFKKLKEIRKNSRKQSEFLSYRVFSKTLDSILIGEFQTVPVFKRFLKFFNFLLKLI